MSRWLLAGLAGASLAVAGCDVGSSEPFVRRTLAFTFESTLVPWEADGTDLDDPPVTWSIERSDARAEEGAWSVRYELENLNDAGKIWLETALGGLTPGVTYQVQIEFDFGSDDGAVNAWALVAGASDDDPETAADLDTHLTATLSPSGAGIFAWDRKEFTTTVTTTDGQIWFAIGVWGTSEFTRTYFVDNVDIEVVRGS